MIFDPTGKELLKMKKPSIIRRYIHAGEGEVTLVSTASNKAHSYQFVKPKNAEEFPENTIFVYVLHEGHKMYLGMLTGDSFRLTSRSSFGEDTESVKGVRYIVKMSQNPRVASDPRMALYSSGRCCKCGRELTCERTIKAGIGRGCQLKYDESARKMPWNGN